MRINDALGTRKTSFGSNASGFVLDNRVVKEFQGTDVFTGIMEASETIAKTPKMPSIKLNFKNICGIPFFILQDGKKWIKTPDVENLTKDGVRETLIEEVTKLRNTNLVTNLLKKIGLR